VASVMEIKWEFLTHFEMVTRKQSNGTVHAYMFDGASRAALCKREIRSSWETDEDVNCEECLDEIQRMFEAFLSTRVKEWWLHPPFYTGRHVERTPGVRPKHTQGELPLGEIDVPVNYHKRKVDYQ